MNVIKTDIEGVLIIEPRLFKDERGYFFESFSQIFSVRRSARASWLDASRVQYLMSLLTSARAVRHMASMSLWN